MRRPNGGTGLKKVDAHLEGGGRREDHTKLEEKIL